MQSKELPGKKRTPKCSRCKNHDIITEIKGHKRYCRWQGCTCDRCSRLQQKQKVMAEQVALRRHQDEEERRGLRVLIAAGQELLIDHEDTKTRKPLCTRCRNHGFKSSLKGHKHSCEFKTCTCPRCLLIKDRSILNRQSSCSDDGSGNPLQLVGSTANGLDNNSLHSTLHSLPRIFPTHNVSALNAILRVRNNEVSATINSIREDTSPDPYAYQWPMVPIPWTQDRWAATELSSTTPPSTVIDHYPVSVSSVGVGQPSQLPHVVVGNNSPTPTFNNNNNSQANERASSSMERAAGGMERAAGCMDASVAGSVAGWPSRTWLAAPAMATYAYTQYQ